MTERIESKVELPQQLMCHKEVLGQEFPIIINGINGILAFPKNELEEKREETRVRINYFHLSFDLKSESLAIEANLIRENFYKWYISFIDFLELESKRVLPGLAPNTRKNPSINFFKSDGTLVNPGVVLRWRVESGEAYPTLNHYQKAIELANNNFSLKLEYQYLRDARLELDRRQFRKAILDAATAVEITLTKAVITNLKASNYSNKKIKKQLHEYMMLSGRIRLAQKLHLNVPCLDFENDLNKRRNKAIHEGAIMDDLIARKAIEVASKTLALLSPELYESRLS